MSEMSAALPIRWASLFADVPATAFDRDVKFWAGITDARPGSPRGERDEFVPLDPSDGDAFAWLQRVEEGDGGWHPDLHVDDVAAACDTARSAGAELLRQADGLATLTSPAGLPFCLADAGQAKRRRPPTPQWDDGRRSLLDQICIDIPAERFEDERDFWAGLTGWPPLDPRSPEFRRLDVPDRFPLQVLVQRLDDDDREGIHAHADLSSDDRAAEVARHVALGATVERIYEHWTTLRDPAGLRYCVTDRVPRRDEQGT